jgi:hypothetical protein
VDGVDVQLKFRIWIKTEGLTRIDTDETDLRTSKSQEQQRNTGVLPHSASLRVRMTDVNKTAPKRPQMAVCVQVLREYSVRAEFMLVGVAISEFRLADEAACGFAGVGVGVGVGVWVWCAWLGRRV